MNDALSLFQMNFRAMSWLLIKKVLTGTKVVAVMVSAVPFPIFPEGKLAWRPSAAIAHPAALQGRFQMLRPEI